jgi:CRP-like cAMP-binding protein
VSGRTPFVQMWIELTTMHAPDYLGEAAMLGRGVRHAAAIADSAVEVLVLLKLDFDLKIDAETRDILNVLVSQYPKDATFIKYAFSLAIGL